MGDDPEGSYGLHDVSLQDKPMFDSCLAAIGSRLSDYSFACSFIWARPAHSCWAMVRGHLCLFANGENGLTLMLPPLGDGDFGAAAREAAAICRQYNADHDCHGNAAVEYVSAPLRERFPADFLAEPMSGDYVYATERMITLAGGDLASKRHDRKRFMTRYEARTEPFEPRHIQPCLDLLTLWHHQSAEAEDCAGQMTRLKRAKDIEATAEALRHYDRIGLTGMVLYAGDDLVGFTFGEMLSDGMCNILVEKTDRRYAGSAQYIFSEFCRQAWPHTAWCNAGDDWDVPSLAYTKQSYRPALRLEKWRMIPPVPVAVSVPETFEPSGAEVGVGADAGERDTETGGDEAVFADLADLDALERRCFPAHLAVTRRQYRYLMRSPTASVRVIRRSGRVVASMIVLRQRTRRGRLARLYSLAVDEAWRGQGLAKALTSGTIRHLGKEGIGSVVLEVEDDNHPALGLYDGLGFRKTRRLIDYYGPDRHGWKMRLELSPAPVLV